MTSSVGFQRLRTCDESNSMKYLSSMQTLETSGVSMKLKRNCTALSIRSRFPMRCADSHRQLTDKSSMLNRSSGHFQALFSANPSVQKTAILRILQQPVKIWLDEMPTIEATIKVIKELKCGKEAGDNSHLISWNKGVRCWIEEKSDFSIYRWITLPYIAGKILQGFCWRDCYLPSLHAHQRGQFIHNVHLSEISINNDVNQGWILTPNQFPIFFNMMLKQVKEDLYDAEGI